MKKHKNIFIFLVYVFGFLFFIFDFCYGAILYLEPSSGTYNQGDTFLVEARLNTQGEYINAVQTNLSFPSNVLEVWDLSQGNSVLTLWIEEPRVSNNTVSFIGGVPGGYQGVDGIVGRIVFRVRESNQNHAQIFFQNDSKVLLNDGKGTEADLITKAAGFNILAKKLEIPEDEWQKELEKDKIPPLPFKIEINQEPEVFEGKYFITFSTTDKETGLDYYEIKEGKRDWKKIISPYVLENQKLFDDIWVKAIDKAGNEWIEIIKAPRVSVWKCVLDVILVLIIILAIIIIWWRISQK